MPNEAYLAFAQTLRWMIAGIAGAAFAKYDLIERDIWYLIGFMVPLILMLTLLEYSIRTLLLNP